MRTFVVLLAASLVGAGGPKGPEAPHLIYQVKFLEMHGLGWRGSLSWQLQPVTRQGAATVWTASRETASKLAEAAAAVEAAPRVTSLPQVRATIFNTMTRRFVAEVSREADGPVNHASFVGFVPRVEDASEGYTAELSGRKLDQGVLTALTLVDRRVIAVHSVPLTEVLEPKPGQDGEKTPVQVTIQIPEYARTEVSGEWLIPKNGVLVVSLGVHTVADPQGKAVVRERLAVFESEDADAPPPGPKTAGISSLDLSRLRRNAQVGIAANPSPALPSHSLPSALDANGRPVEMPPLPEGKTVTMLPGSTEPCASPQAGGTSTADGSPLPLKKSQIRDTEASLTGLPTALPFLADSVKYFPAGPDFPWANTQASTARARLQAQETQARGTGDKAPAPPCCDAGADCTEVEPAPAVNTPTGTGKSFRFSVPLSPALKIEVDARITPTPSPSAATGAGPRTENPAAVIARLRKNYEERLEAHRRSEDPGLNRVQYPLHWKFAD